MLKRSYRVLGLAWMLGVFPGLPMALAQAGRPWVDPPSDFDAPATADDTAATDLEATNAVPDRSATKPALESETATRSEDTARIEEKSAPDRRMVPAHSPRRAATKGPPQKTVADRRGNWRSGRQRAGPPASKQQTFAARPGKERGVDDDAVLENGLEIMNLRTIEFPDGRRIRILTKPDPETVRRVLARPRF